MDNTIISRLTDLKYLGKIKKFNVSHISKKSEYHDIVKFYAQINKDNVIQKISFQATGCTTFMAVCSYFCEMIEGKKVTTALKVNRDNFESVVKVKEKDEHVFAIILNTFKLLINKYNKGVESGKIIPAEVIDTKDNIVTKKQPSHKTSFVDRSIDMYLEETPSKTVKEMKEKVVKPQKIEDKKEETIAELTEMINNDSVETDKTEVIDEKPKKVKSKVKKEKVEKVEISNTEKPKKKKSKKEKVKDDKTLEIVPADNINISNEIVEENTEKEPVMSQEKVVKVVEIHEETHVTKKDDAVVEIKTTKKTNEVHLGHLSSLQEKLKVKEQHEKSDHNIRSLNSLLQKMETHNNHNQEQNEIIIKEEPKKKEKVKKEKKSLFSWFKKK